MPRKVLFCASGIVNGFGKIIKKKEKNNKKRWESVEFIQCSSLSF
jgi:hypothetical protein